MKFVRDTSLVIIIEKVLTGMFSGYFTFYEFEDKYWTLPEPDERGFFHGDLCE